MTETVEALTLPLLPLTTGVVLPQMVVTLALETAEARDAADGAIAGDRRVLLVPRVGAGYTRVGTVARVENEGELPGGQRALVLRGLSRAVVGRTVPSDHPGLWVEVEPVAEPSTVSGRAREMVREYRAVVRGIAEKLGTPRIAEALAGVDDPGALADTAGWAPDLSVERKVELLEELDPEARLEKALAWVRETLAELDLSEQIRNRVTEGMDKTQREFLLRQQMSGDPRGAGRVRRRRRRGGRVPHQAGRAGRQGALPDDVRGGDRARGRPLRAHERAEPRARLDPHLARHRVRDPVGHALRRDARRR